MRMFEYVMVLAVCPRQQEMRAERGILVGDRFYHSKKRMQATAYWTEKLKCSMACMDEEGGMQTDCSEEQGGAT